MFRFLDSHGFIEDARDISSYGVEIFLGGFCGIVAIRFFLLFLNQRIALRLQLADGRHFIGKALLQKCPRGVVQIELRAVFFAKTLFVLCLKESAVDGFVGMVLPDIVDLLV